MGTKTAFHGMRRAVLISVVVCLPVVVLWGDSYDTTTVFRLSPPYLSRTFYCVSDLGSFEVCQLLYPAEDLLAVDRQSSTELPDDEALVQQDVEALLGVCLFPRPRYRTVLFSTSVVIPHWCVLLVLFPIATILVRIIMCKCWPVRKKTEAA